MVTIDDRTTKLVNALIDAFPAEPIRAEWIDEPTANWTVYDDVAELRSLVGISWAEVSADFLTRHPTLPIYAGTPLSRDAASVSAACAGGADAARRVALPTRGSAHAK